MHANGNCLVCYKQDLFLRYWPEGHRIANLLTHSKHSNNIRLVIINIIFRTNIGLHMRADILSAIRLLHEHILHGLNTVKTTEKQIFKQLTRLYCNHVENRKT